MKKLTEKQQRILKYIAEATAAQGYPPSVREIGQHVGLRSSSSVHAQLTTLRERGYLEKNDRKTRSIVIKSMPNNVSHIPILGQVTAGTPILAIEQVQGYLPYMPVSEGEYFALRIRGDSMIEAGILDGDYIIVRRQDHAQSGQIVVACIEDEATCKTLRIESDGQVWLMPENPHYDPIDGRQAVILGIVMGLHREYTWH